ncbi:MAG: pyruvate:ferredoxin (flavodoxin) oxidoreductase, partial [Desulfosporosinus sp.]
IKSRVPFLHFFDGFRTSHEIQKIEVINEQEIAEIVDWQAIQAFRDRALSPEHPVVRGTNQNPDIYFQGREVANLYYQAVPDIVENYLQEIKRITGREYHPFDYYGSPDAESVIVAMGSVCGTIEETLDYLMAKGEKVGVIKVRLYRPFSEKYFFNVLPPTVRKIAVLDRTKEPGAPAEPLCLDVVHLFSKREIKPQIIGGRYGLGSKDTRPAQIIAVFDNLKQDQPKDGFTIGIIDDVTHTSLPEVDPVKTNPEGTISCKFYGLGSDGTVGANKLAIKIIGDNTPLYAQGYFAYDSKKSGGTTISHLRFGKKPIKSTYLVFQADYIACHNKSFIYNYDLVKGLKPNGTFVLNCPWKPEELDRELPASLRRYIAQNKINFHIIDAVKIACDIGLGGRINMIMQAAFFKLANVIPVDDAVNCLKESLAKTYGNKGQKIVDMNIAAVDRGIQSLQKVAIPQTWVTAELENTPTLDEPAFIKKIQRPMARNEGDNLPVSTFLGSEDGAFPVGTTAYEKRRIAVMIPEWQIEKCIQCNQCSLICPHATIRPFLLSDNEQTKAPAAFQTKKPLAKGLEVFHYRIQIDPLDCTGCGNCADICPALGKALVMQSAAPQMNAQADNWYFACTVTEKNGLMDPKSVIGSQYRRPLFEFSGACPGCGETPYIKLITQLFGDR